MFFAGWTLPAGPYITAKSHIAKMYGSANLKRGYHTFSDTSYAGCADSGSQKNGLHARLRVVFGMLVLFSTCTILNPFFRSPKSSTSKTNAFISFRRQVQVISKNRLWRHLHSHRKSWLIIRSVRTVQWTNSSWKAFDGFPGATKTLF